MRTLALTAAVAAAALVSAPAAHAHPTYHYEGGCIANAVSDEPFNQPTWTVSVTVVAMATHADLGVPAPVATWVKCFLRINSTSGGTFLHGYTPVGVALAYGGARISVDSDDVVEVCEDVTVGGDHHVACAPVTFVQAD